MGNGTNWRTLSEIEYNKSGLMSKQTYGNGDFVEFSYDNLDRQTQTRYNGDNSLRITYSYGNNGSVAQITDGEEEISYAYNGDGQRVSKTVNGTTTEFIYNGDILAGQKTGNDVLVFMYDNNGDPFGFICNGTEYYYIKNAQNDVTAIASADGTILANYYYDSWGKLIETTGNATIAELNPIRYRSYYYDSETEWYYLNTRYYSPELCRFISSDGYIQTGQGLLDKNMFAYCLNNPIIRFDSNGNSWSDVKNWFSNTFNKAKQWVEDLFSPGKSKDNVQQYNPHKKKGTTSPHNRNKHEEGQTRRNRDNGGEKGDKRRTPNPNKRRTANSSMVILKKVAVCAVAIVAVVGIVYVVANDATVVGIIDDAIIAPLGAIVWECASKVLA